MALIEFSSIAAGPFIMFKESAEEIFKRIGEPFVMQGGWDVEDLPGILTRLQAAEEKDRAEVRARTAELEALRRTSGLGGGAAMQREEELEREIKANAERVNFYQRAVPLRKLIERAVKGKKPVMWQPM